MKLILILTLFIAKVLCAQPNPVELLKSVQERFKSINDLSADITQTVNSTDSKKGKLYFKQNESYRLELVNQIIITDGKTFWNYNKKQKKLIIDNFQKSNDNIFSINYLLFEVPNKSNISASIEGNLRKLILNSKEGSFPYVIIELLISPDNLVRHVKAIDNARITYEVKFDNYVLNQNLKDDIFSFKPAEGIKVIDLR